MSIDSHGARLTRRDVVALAEASEQLAVVSGMIRSSGVKWAEVSVNLLIVVNNTIVRIQTKGASAFARYLEKHPLETAPLSVEDKILEEKADLTRNEWLDKREKD